VTDVRKMQAMLDIIKHQEVHIQSTVWDIIGPYSMQTRFTSRSSVGPRPSFEETLVGFDHFLDFDRLVEDGAPRRS
jgi:hypothetical protein